MAKLSCFAGLMTVAAVAAVAALPGCSPDPQLSPQGSVADFEKEPVAESEVAGSEVAEPELSPEDYHRQCIVVAEQYLQEQNGVQMVEKTELVDGTVHVYANRELLKDPVNIEILATLFYVYEREYTNSDIESFVHVHFSDTGALAGQHQVDTIALQY